MDGKHSDQPVPAKNPGSSAELPPVGKVGDTPIYGSSHAPKPAPTPTERKLLPTPGGSYWLLQALSAHGTSELWKAEDPQGQLVAVKITQRGSTAESRELERKTLSAWQATQHKGLVKLLHYWPQEDRLVQVMTLVEGSVLDRQEKCLRAGLPDLPVWELLTYMRESAETLDFLHSQQLVHGDVKPDKLLLSQGHAQLAGGGLPRRWLIANATPVDAAPEAWRGEVMPASDQYSLAASYAELRQNRPVYASATTVERMLDHMERTPNLTSLPVAEQKVVLKALSKDAKDRYPSCTMFVQALEEAVSGSAGKAGLKPASSPKIELTPPAVAVPSVSIPPLPSLPSVSVPSLPSLPSVSVPGVATAGLAAAAIPSLGDALKSVASTGLPGLPSLPSLPSVSVPHMPALPSVSVPGVATAGMAAAAIPSLGDALKSVASTGLPGLPSLPSLPSVTVPSLPVMATAGLTAALPEMPAVTPPGLANPGASALPALNDLTAPLTGSSPTVALPEVVLSTQPGIASRQLADAKVPEAEARWLWPSIWLLWLGCFVMLYLLMHN